MSKRTPIKRRTINDYINAIHKHHGIITYVAEELGVHRAAVYRMRERHERVAIALNEARERMTDHVENKLMQRINEGDTTATIFYLKTQGKARGYVERTEVQQTGGLRIEVVYEDSQG